MTEELVVPVSAPGSQQAATDINRAAAAAEWLAKKEDQLAASIKKTALEMEREKVMVNNLIQRLGIVNETWSKYDSITRRITSNPMSMGGGGGGGGGMFGGGGGGGEGGFSAHRASTLLRVAGAGEFGHLFHGVQIASAFAGSALGVTAIAAVGAGVAIHKMIEAENERLDKIEEEVKFRQQLNDTLQKAAEQQQNKAASGFESTIEAKRFLATRGREYRPDLAMEKTKDFASDEAVNAMAKLMRTKEGSKMTVAEAMEEARKISSTGVTSAIGALNAMASAKNPRNAEGIVQSLGGTGGMYNMTHEAKMFDESKGIKTSMDLIQERNKADLDATNRPDLVNPALRRQVEEAVDPVGVAHKKFNEELHKSVAILEARADAENKHIAILKDHWLARMFGGKGSAETIYGKAQAEEQHRLNETR